jgi:hypothetical protein
MPKLDRCPISTEVSLTAECGDISQTIRLLTGAVMALGGEILLRSLHGDHSGGFEFMFPRLDCIENYCLLIAAGLALSGDGHRRLTVLCQCTRERLAEAAGESVTVRLHLVNQTEADRAAFRTSLQECLAE